MIQGELDPAAVARASDVLDRFLADRNDRTIQAYTTDLDEFARFLDASPTAALAQLFSLDAGSGRQVVLEYVVSLRRMDRAQSTIDRRLGTLRALLRTAHEAGLVAWQLDVPDDEEVVAAMERLPARDSDHYLFPRHPGEVDRLDIQHFALRETLGANYIAPVGQLDRVLDVGCGTGQWGFEICRQANPKIVVGVDLVAGKRHAPEQYRFVKGDVMSGLPFGDGRFDFVHQRLLVSGLPLKAWPGVVADLARVVRPGGWVELIEVPWEIRRAGPAAQRLVDLTVELTGSLGLDTTGTVYRNLQDYLSAAGLVDVERREIEVRVGRWGGAVGSLMVTDFRAGVTRVCEVLQARGRLTADESRTLIQEAQEEWQHGQMAYPFAIAYGRRPD